MVAIGSSNGREGLSSLLEYGFCSFGGFRFEETKESFSVPDISPTIPSPSISRSSPSTINVSILEPLSISIYESTAESDTLSVLIRVSSPNVILT